MYNETIMDELKMLRRRVGHRAFLKSMDRNTMVLYDVNRFIVFVKLWMVEQLKNVEINDIEIATWDNVINKYNVNIMTRHRFTHMLIWLAGVVKASFGFQVEFNAQNWDFKGWMELAALSLAHDNKLDVRQLGVERGSATRDFNEGLSDRTLDWVTEFREAEDEWNME